MTSSGGRSLRSVAGVRRWGALLLLLLPLAGCGDPVEVDPAVYAEDGFGEMLQRTFQPREYWGAKAEAMTHRVEAEKEALKQRHQAYRAVLDQRRQEIQAAAVKAQTEGGDPREARRAIILAYRERLQVIRRENREMSRHLRQHLQWLKQVRAAYQASVI